MFDLSLSGLWIQETIDIKSYNYLIIFVIIDISIRPVWILYNIKDEIEQMYVYVKVKVKVGNYSNYDPSILPYDHVESRKPYVHVESRNTWNVFIISSLCTIFNVTRSELPTTFSQRSFLLIGLLAYNTENFIIRRVWRYERGNQNP